MIFHIITLFPEVFEPYFNASIIGRAKNKGLIKIKLYNLRDFLKSKERADDRPYGGGPGMVLRIEPLARAVDKIMGKGRKAKIIIFSPSGKAFNDKKALDLSKHYREIVLIAGHYEGLDERIKNILKSEKHKFEEISVGPYVLTGGEVPAMILVDAVSRKIPRVLGKEESLEEKRLGIGIPSYSRPEVFIYKRRKYRVPKILLSGNHRQILKWRLEHKKK